MSTRLSMGCVNRAIVVGGGIGGMVAAIALSKRGIKVHVIEAARPEDQLGTGINLQNNALRALEEVGLLEDCKAEGFGWNTVTTRDGTTGDILATNEMPWPKAPGRPGALGIMRTTFAEILARHARTAGVKISYSTKVSKFEQDDQKVTVELTDGLVDHADVLVAADGAYSQMRSIIFGADYKPSYIGQGVWRFTVPRPKSLDGFNLFRAEQGRSLGFLPLSDDLAYYFYLETTEKPLRVPVDQAAAMMSERMAQFPAPQVQEVLHCLDEGWHVSFRPFDILLMPAPWHRGRAVIIGDVAHSLTPQLTSGAGMALEDAVVLADELAGCSDLEAALSAFSARRFERAGLVYNNSLRICELEKGPQSNIGEGVKIMMDSFNFLSQPY